MNRQDFCKTRLREKLRQRACEVFYRLIKKLPHRITVATFLLGPNNNSQLIGFHPLEISRRSEEEICHYRYCSKRRHPLLDVPTEGIYQHNRSKKSDGIHCPIFQIFVFLDAFDVSCGQLSNCNSSYGCSYHYEWNRKSESKRAEHTID